jgi:hypothetical protein
MNKEQWIAQQHGRKAVLYVVRVWSDDEAFYKIGITFSFSTRFSGLKTSYKYRSIARYSSYNAGKIFDLEQALHRKLSGFSYRPAADFSGRTECYRLAEQVLAAMPTNTFFLKNTTTLI